MTKQATRLELNEVGSLPAGERAAIKGWLIDNFCTEETFECTLHELRDGGFSLEDTMDALAADDDAFGVHVLESEDDRPSFLVILFEDLPQGIIVDRGSLEIVGEVIEGDIVEVSDGYEGYIPVIRAAVPVLR